MVKRSLRWHVLRCRVFGRSRFVRTRGIGLGVGVAKDFAAVLIDQIVNADDEAYAGAVIDSEVLCERDGSDNVLVRLVQLADLAAGLAEHFFEFADDVALPFGHFASFPQLSVHRESKIENAGNEADREDKDYELCRPGNLTRKFADEFAKERFGFVAFWRSSRVEGGLLDELSDRRLRAVGLDERTFFRKCEKTERNICFSILRTSPSTTPMNLRMGLAI